MTLRLWRALKPRLAAEGMTTVYETLERPLIAAAGADGSARRVDRPRHALAPVGRIRARHGADRSRGAEAGRARRSTSASPKQLGDILFGQMGLPGGKKTATGAWSTVGRRARRPRRTGPRAAGAHSRLAPARQAEVDLHRRAAELRRSAHRARPHLLRAGLDHHRAAVVVRPQSAEHPGAQRGRAQDPPRLRRRAGLQADLGRLFADRAAPARPCRRHRRAEAGLRRRARHPRDDRLGNVRRAGRRTCRARCAAAPRRSISASSTAFRPSASPTSSASRATRRAPTSGNISSASPASATIWTTTKKQARADGYVTHHLRPQVPFPAHQRRQPVRARVQRARGDQRADPGRRRRHHPPRDDAHGRRARRRRSSTRRCCCRCTTNWCSRRPTTRSRRRSRWRKGHGRRARAGGEARRAARGRSARGAATGTRRTEGDRNKQNQHLRHGRA